MITSRKLIWLLMLFAFSMVGCVVDSSMSHQGQLLDSNGNPVPDGTYEIIYKLYSAKTGGTLEYEVTKNVEVEDGLFSGSFADGANPKIFTEPVWVELTIDGEVLSPRRELQGAAYASALTAGGAAIGSAARAYTFDPPGIGDSETYSNLGASFFAANTDITTNGGHGIVAATAAQNVGSAALYVRALGDATSQGPYGALIYSEDYRGLYVDGGPNWYSILATQDSRFEGDISVGGNCVGCRSAMQTVNVGEAALHAGDVVEFVGVTADGGRGVPMVEVQLATGRSVNILGVVADKHHPALGEIDPAAGIDDAQPVGVGARAVGDIVTVITEGLVQVNTPGRATWSFGDLAVVAVTDDSAEISLGTVMSELENGQQWVLLGHGQ